MAEKSFVDGGRRNNTYIYIYIQCGRAVYYIILYIYVCIRERGKKKEACMHVFVRVCASTV